jgi:ferredoxin-thioredoxin reductase catalytic subunit
VVIYNCCAVVTSGCLQEQQQLFEVMAANGIPRRYTHCMAKFMPQDEWAYAAGLCRLAAGASPYQQQQQQQEQQQHGEPCTLNVSSLNCSCSRHHHDMQQDRACDCHLPTAAQSTQPRHLSSQLQHQQASSSMDAEQQQQQQQQQQQHGLLVMPWWLRALAAEVAGDILSRPDSFRWAVITVILSVTW